MARMVVVARSPEPEKATERRWYGDVVGTPERARACECMNGVWLSDDDGDTCLRCGCHSAEVIRETWRGPRPEGSAVNGGIAT